MAKNYMICPMQTFRITQSYDGTTSHLPHMTGTPKEYALDLGGKDTGRDWILCPCDEMKVAKLTGVGTKGTNAVYLTSTKKVDLANGTQSIATMQLVHPNDDDLKKLKEGQTFKRGEKICREGNDGTSGNHVHMAVGLGTIVGTGWQQNSKQKWVLVTTGGPIKPEDAFFVDRKVTTVKDTKGLKFKDVPTPSDASGASSPKGGAKPGKYRVTVNVLNVRYGTSTKTPIKYVLGYHREIDIVKIKTGLDGKAWGKADGLGWVRMEYLEKVR